MDGDPRNPGVSLLKKYDIPIEHLSYEYVEKCSNKKELERIIRILRSGEEGSYPHLLKAMEDRLRVIAADSRVLRVETPILTKDSLTKEEWNAVENELLSWEKEMNIMDKSLDFEKGRMDVVGNKNLPEVRKVEQKNILQKTNENTKKAVDNINNKNKTNNNNMRIKSGDYRGWDKYDVDKELLRIDVEEERKDEINEKKKREAKKLEKEKKIEIAEIEKENYSSMEQQVLATQAKDRGNECYKSGDLKSALKYYEISIRLYPTANAYNNRAMTYIKLKQFDKALEDCNKVLHLEKNNVKALLRRATVYQNMQNDAENCNYDELALQDLCEIIRLEPNNKVAQADIQKLKKKLNIEDSGKKFRLPISDGLVSNVASNKIEEKSSTHNIKENNISTERLPLTYYGPSTSTFQCEPYSMVHRALSGSSIPGRVLCKCNSNIPRQNPLCQKCGEAMCTPKPTKTENKSKSEKNKEIPKAKTNVSNVALPEKNKIENPVKNSCLSKSQSEVKDEQPKVEEKKKQEEKSTVLGNQKQPDNKNVNEINKNNSICEKVPEKPVDDTKVITSNKADNSIREKVPEKPADDTKVITSNKADNSIIENTNSEIVSKNTESNLEEASPAPIKPSKNDKIKNTEVASNKNNETKTAEKSSSQKDVNRSSKKSKEAKESKALRKRLETFKIEPVKVVHAAKYLHPTSVEPKVKSESSPDLHRESTPPGNTQFKAFVPNRKCYSTEIKRMDPSTATAVPSALKENYSPPCQKNNNDLPSEGKKENVMGNIQTNSAENNDLTSEGNKENFMGNIRTNNVENETKEDGVGEGKKDFIDSAYEFTKAWEELKFDKSYVKRAEIICKIRPCDLSKVIGIKLNSDMLSSILECLSRHVIEKEPKRVVELLNQLPQIPRFELICMFLEETDKNNMKKLIQAAENKGFKLDEDAKKKLTALR